MTKEISAWIIQESIYLRAAIRGFLTSQLYFSMTTSQPQNVLVTGASGLSRLGSPKPFLREDTTYEALYGVIKKENTWRTFSQTGSNTWSWKIFKRSEQVLFVVYISPLLICGIQFDDVVKGMDIIDQTVSPFHYDAEDPQDLVAIRHLGHQLNILRRPHWTSCSRDNFRPWERP